MRELVDKIIFNLGDREAKKKRAYVQSERARAVQLLVAVYTNERVPTLVQGSLETNDDKLERVRRVRADIIGDLGDVRIVQRGVYLVEDEERAWLIAAKTV